MGSKRILLAIAAATIATSAQAQFYGNLTPSPSEAVQVVEPGQQPMGAQEPCFASIATPQCALVKSPGESSKPQNPLSDSLGSDAQAGEGGEATADQVAAVTSRLAASFLQGDERLACEAILCLAAPVAPGACAAALARYFSIKFKNPAKTLSARAAFLNLCPMASDASIAQLIASLTGGAGNCDASTLNIRLTRTTGTGENAEATVSSKMPPECETYFANTNIGTSKPRYVGPPEGGGRWVKAEEYEEAQALYLAQQQAAEQSTSQNGGRGEGP